MVGGLGAGETPGESVFSCAGADKKNADGHERQKRNADSRGWSPHVSASQTPSACPTILPGLVLSPAKRCVSALPLPHC